MDSLSFEPLINSFAWVMLAIAGVAALGWYSAHRPSACRHSRWWPACALMFAALAAALTILLNPTWIEPIPPPAGKPLLTVLVDASASMATADVPGQRTRFQSAAAIAADVADKLDDQFDVRVRTFAAVPAAADLAELPELLPDGQLTDLATAVAGSLEDDRPQGQALFVVSDGAHNAPGGVDSVLEVARTARAMAAPIYSSTVGGATQPADLELVVPRSQELAFVGQRVPVRVRIRQRGAVAGRARVEIVADGEPLDSQVVNLQPDADSHAVLHVKPAENGLYQFDVRVEHFGAELTDANNRAIFQVRVVKEPIRLLVLEGKPYWDGKFLLRTLAADASLEVDFVVRMTEGRFIRRRLQLAPGDSAQVDASAVATDGAAPDAADDSPVRREEVVEVLDGSAGLLDDELLRGSRVVVLGRDAEVFLAGEGLDHLATWMSRDGGSLVCYRGSPVASPDQTLGRLLPVRWTPGQESRFRVQVTERGENISWLSPAGASPQSLGLLPSLASGTATRGIRPLAVVLGNSEGGDATPVLTYQPVGTGRAVAIEGAGMWRWAFLAPEYRAHDDAYGDLWQSLIRWLVSSAGLAPGQNVAFRSDRVAFQAGEPVSATLLRRTEAADSPLAVELRRNADDAPRTVSPVPVGNEPGVFLVSFGALEPGRYEARLVGIDADNDAATAVAFEVRDNHAEQLDIAARPDLMSRIALDSGGRVFDDADAAAISTEFADHLSRTRPVRVRRVTAWDRWWVLTGIIACWGAAWAIRRSTGLI